MTLTVRQMPEFYQLENGVKLIPEDAKNSFQDGHAPSGKYSVLLPLTEANYQTEITSAKVRVLDQLNRLGTGLGSLDAIVITGFPNVEMREQVLRLAKNVFGCRKVRCYESQTTSPTMTGVTFRWPTPDLLDRPNTDGHPA